MKRIILIVVFIVMGFITYELFQRPHNPLTVAPIIQPLDIGNGFLKIQSQNIIDENGTVLHLKGINLGGWLMYEDWIFKDKHLNFPIATGYNQTEKNIKAYLDKQYGTGIGAQFFKGIRDNFITEDDFTVIRDLGSNVVRIPIAHWLIQDESAFNYIDQAITWAKKNDLYIILDLHTVPGCQNTAEFCIDRPKTATFWSDAQQQNTAIELWKGLARRYRDESTIAGYDILSEPYIDEGLNHDEQNNLLQNFYIQLISAIRKIDQNHILFVQGAGWGLDLSVFNSGWLSALDDNAVYSLHIYRDTHCPILSNYKKNIREFFDQQIHYIAEYELPIYIGEYGGICSDWLEAAHTVFKENNIHIATYFTYKSAVHYKKGKSISIIDEKNDWVMLVTKLKEGKSITDIEWRDAFNDLGNIDIYSQKPDYNNNLSNYITL